MLTKSSKSRLAAMALMALGATTFMGTSAALATTETSVEVSGRVECSASTTTLSSNDNLDVGAIPKGGFATVNLRVTMAQGMKNAACDKKNGTVTAEMAPLENSGSAKFEPTNPNPVTVTLGIVDGPNASGLVLIPVTATVPAAANSGTFGAVVNLTLVDDT
jgi:hypothetical protein